MTSVWDLLLYSVFMCVCAYDCFSVLMYVCGGVCVHVRCSPGPDELLQHRSDLLRAHVAQAANGNGC